MRKHTIFGIVVITLLILSLVVLAESIRATKPSLRTLAPTPHQAKIAREHVQNNQARIMACKDSTSDTCIKEHQQQKNNAKTILTSHFNITIAHLGNARDKISALNISDEQKLRMFGQLDERIAMMRSLNERVNKLANTSTAKEFKQSINDAKQEEQRARHAAQKANALNALMHTQGVLHKTIALEKKLNHTLTKANEQGIDTTTLTKYVTNFTVHVSTARTFYNEASASINNTTITNLPEQIKIFKNTLKNAHDHLRGASKELKTFQRELKRLHQQKQTRMNTTRGDNT